MARLVPDDDDTIQFVADVRRLLILVKARPDAAKIIAERPLAERPLAERAFTDGDVLFLIAFSI